MKILNEKNREFCEEYVKNGYNGGGAYALVYGQKDPASAAVGASQLLKQQRIRDYIDVVEGNFKILGQLQGVDKRTIIAVIKEMLQATKVDKGVATPDWAARNNAINTFSRLAGFEEKNPKGGLLDDDDDKEVNTKDMTDDEKRIYREKLLADLS